MKDNNTHKKFTSLEDIKKTGFSTPENFFNSFEDDLFSKISEENLPSKNGFSTPDGYFEELENQIFDKIALEEKPEAKVISLKSRILKTIPYAAAASVLLFIGLNYFSSINNSVTFEDLSTTEIENWLDTDISGTEIAEVISEIDFNEADFTNNINDTEIEDYLDNIDTSTLLNEIN